MITFSLVHARSSISTRRLSPLATDWASFLREKKRFCSDILLFAAPDAIYSKISLVNVNSILPLNQMKIASISNSFEQLYLG